MSKPLLNTTPVETTTDKDWKESCGKYGEASFTATKLEDDLMHTLKSSTFLTYISVEDDDEESFFLQTVYDDDGDEWYAIYTTVENAQDSSILEDADFPDRHNVLVEVDYEFLLNELFNTGDDEIYGVVIDPETEAFTLSRDTLSHMGAEENEGVDHHETIGHRVPGNMEFAWLYSEYMEAEGDDEKDKFQLLMEDVVERSCLALMTIVNETDLVTLPDGTYELKQDASMIIPSLSAEDEEGNDLSYLPLFTSNEQIDKWGIKENVELKEGQVLISQCRPFNQHVSTFLGAGEYDALLINPFDQAFIISKEFIKAVNGQQEEDETPAA
ncbi:SseB family protein [uncultured Catenibacterium sp.]|uniref:SseB family protein n=1 Tax=uncultured Catenibacterium sp. TaxID=286142 RepID=UPI0025ED587E|nr:SseB family protein [uncultured Catenibacterium sp.]